MSTRTLALLAVSLLLASLAAYFLLTRLQTQKTEPTPVAASVSRVLVAKRDISPGNFVRAAQDLEWVEAPPESITPNQIREGTEAASSFDGAVARRAVKQGERVPEGALIPPGGGGFLSAVLEPGMRAASLGVTATSGNAGFIMPGDRVDLIVTHRVKIAATPNNEAEEAIISETFIENVRVVAVDQKLDNKENKAAVAKTITVEATPKQAEKIQVAAELGKVSFVLRSISDSTMKNGGGSEITTTIDDKTRQSFTRDYEVSPSLQRSSGANARIRVIRGEASERLEFYGGSK